DRLKMVSTHDTHLVVPLIFIIVVLSLNFIQAAGLTFSLSSSLPGRILLQTDNVSQPLTQPDDTVRVDPLDSFKKYRGGYDITNKHYWSSVIFTGIYGYAIGFLWLLGGIVLGGFLLSTMYCFKGKGKLKKRSLCYKQCNLWPILLAIFFTVLAIAAAGLVLGGNARFNSQARTVVNIIIETANEASETIHNTTGAMRNIVDNLGTSNDSREDASGFLISTSEKLDVEAADIERQARKNRHLIDKGLKIVYAITTVTVVLNLIAVIGLSVSGVLRLTRAFHMLIILCWFLTVLCWVFFGLYFFLHKFSSDTCTALENFQENPSNNSLSSILPCDELLAEKSILYDVSSGIYDLVNEVNANISHLQKTTDLSIAYVCNPFSPPPEHQYQPENCPANTIRIGDIPKVLQIFTCSDANNGSCKEGEFISYSEYKTVVAYTSSIQTLLNAYPGMEDLIECQSVKNAFSEILLKHCQPLKRYVHMVWSALLFLSLIMMVSVLIWAAQAHHEQELHSLQSSVKPHYTTACGLEVETTKIVKDNKSSSNSV
ncbi:hypothetical protein CFOL_v3_34017, partial [Cephalotus follicularis]